MGYDSDRSDIFCLLEMIADLTMGDDINYTEYAEIAAKHSFKICSEGIVDLEE